MSEFFTIAQESVFDFTEKRSKFISYSFRVSSQQEVRERLNAIKTEHWSAKHHVYAYVLNEGNSVKCSDDGEPGGTGGMPILNAIQSASLKDTLVIVVRYFGGILLGTAGLRSAYKCGAENVLELSGKTLFKLCKRVRLEVGYDKYSTVLNGVSDFGGKILESNFEDTVKLEIAVPEEEFERFDKWIFQSCGDVASHNISKDYIHI